MKIKHLIASIALNTVLVAMPVLSWAQSASNTNTNMNGNAQNQLVTSMKVSFQPSLNSQAPVISTANTNTNTNTNTNSIAIPISMQVQQGGWGFTVQKYLLLGCLGMLMGLAIFLFL